jgi:hypothetical protein
VFEQVARTREAASSSHHLTSCHAHDTSMASALALC